jgi:hypothetical protein
MWLLIVILSIILISFKHSILESESIFVIPAQLDLLEWNNLDYSFAPDSGIRSKFQNIVFEETEGDGQCP